MTRDQAPPDRLRVRLGMALQRQRQQRGLSQSQLAKLANLSLKYVGEIERGEANVTMDALEQVASAIQWDPLEQSVRERQDAFPEGIRILVLTELFHVLQVVQTSIGWLQRLDSTGTRGAAGQAQAEGPMQPGWGQQEEAPIRRRGRPRKVRTPAPEDAPGPDDSKS